LQELIGEFSRTFHLDIQVDFLSLPRPFFGQITFNYFQN